MCGISGSGNLVLDGLVLYLDAGNPKSYVSGSTVWNDLSGNGNNGTLYNGVGYSSSNNGTLTFDGSNDYVDTNYLMPISNFTINIIYKMNTYIASGWDMLFGSDLWNSSYGYVAYFGTPTILSFQRSNALALNVTVTDNPMNYNFYSFTLSSLGLASIYINGKLISTMSSFATSTIINKSIYLGARHGNDGTNIKDLSNCSIPVFQTYNRALSQQEILQNYNTIKNRYN